MQNIYSTVQYSTTSTTPKSGFSEEDRFKKFTVHVCIKITVLIFALFLLTKHSIGGGGDEDENAGGPP